ncbi:nitrogenase molybdenum-iron cofactor biosynthesis protein NifX [Syntrophotalea carbinolica DSM 2380]|uniref:Nitrogenase molybdenum-iron cofactor biosynthesis protein NifX n=1 Tax=Syntrophotalea carbinolica (strain DSM 2380 / NBRC 103641 / GraBd1) TaxID=338963 RepID=Q3A2R6_SYNC1|nr:nitrogen fixation protein NifX [Syntrophotalea carbinolica]ABA89341.1 nitrogenase molybdenum-iron cofactor biosynthesis protein NifX [Syntrophotalea carbinolica DSM 2380]
MKIAFATSDNETIDQHFAQANQFAVWEIASDQASFSGLEEIEATDDNVDDKINARLKVLGDCTIIYVTQIGGPAAARLVANKIHPVKSKGEEKIEDVVDKLQQVLKNNPPPWLRRAMNK